MAGWGANARRGLRYSHARHRHLRESRNCDKSFISVEKGPKPAVSGSVVRRMRCKKRVLQPPHRTLGAAENFLSKEQKKNGDQ